MQEALQAVHDGDQHVLDAPIFQLGHDPQPELRALGLLDPQAEKGFYAQTLGMFQNRFESMSYIRKTSASRASKSIGGPQSRNR
jgi:hypothetical protein